MDPITAVGLASSIVASITFRTSLVTGAIKIHESLDGALDDHRSREAITVAMSRFASKLLPPDDSQLAGEESYAFLPLSAETYRANSSSCLGVSSPQTLHPEHRVSSRD